MLKKIIYFFSLSLNIIFIAALVYLGTSFNITLATKNTGKTAIVTPAKDTVRQRKPIQLELMTAEDKTSFGLSATSTSRMQVLERDENGKVTTYRVLYSDKDIITEY